MKKDEFLDDILGSNQDLIEHFVEIYDEREKILSVESEGREYLVFDKDGNENARIDFLLKKYSENLDATVVLIYKNFEQLLNDCYTIKKLHVDLGLSRKELAGLLISIKSNSLTFFTAVDVVNLELEGLGENYLYKEDSNAVAYVYNLKVDNLLKILNCQGTGLFKENIRKGSVTSGVESKFLYAKFLEKVLTDYIFCIEKTGKYSDYIVSLKKYFKIEVESDGLKDLNLFWFKHNGITIVESEQDALLIRGNTIEARANKIQVINGAQTLTKLLDIRTKIKKYNEEDKHQIALNDYLESIFKKIIVKTTIIKFKTTDIIEKKSMIKEITEGLNTQIPIKQFDLFTENSTVVLKLKDRLSKWSIEIINEAQESDNFRFFDLKKIIQSYYIFVGEPGTARNLTATAITNSKLEKILEKLIADNFSEEFCCFMNYQMKIDAAWKKDSEIDSEIKDDREYQFMQALKSNGLTLFKSYLTNYIRFSDLESDNDLNREVEVLLTDFYVLFKTRIIDNNEYDVLNSNNFKNNLIYQDLIETKEKKTVEKKTLSMIVELLNSPQKNKESLSKSSHYKLIKDMLSKKILF